MKKRSRFLALSLGALLWLPGGTLLATERCEEGVAQSLLPPVEEPVSPESSLMQGMEIVGEEVSATFSSPAAAESRNARGEVVEVRVWRQEIYSTGASYIAPHFGAFQLPEGARLVVSSPDGSRSWEYRGVGKAVPNEKDGFWGIHISGETAVLELFAKGAVPAGAVVVDRFARGFPPDPDAGYGPEAICGIDDSDWARCYQSTDPRVYNTSRAVARLLINGTGACTGWLVGSAGHLMTNEHCIGSAADAANTNYEFMAEGATCATNCATWFGCPGNVVATSATLVQSNINLDYTLVRLPTNPVGTYGFLQMRTRGTSAGERIYIPQHPQGWGKRIALHSTHPVDSTGYCQVQSVSRPPCLSVTVRQVGYYCDTQGGSSGSPVLGLCDNAVLALHNCAFCPNRGVPIDTIIRDLGDHLPPNSTLGSWGCDDCGPGWCQGEPGQYCDRLGCYPEDSTISRAFCQCGLLDPTCGVGGCIGLNYVTGDNCQFGLGYSSTAPQSQIMCQGLTLNPDCSL